MRQPTQEDIPRLEAIIQKWANKLGRLELHKNKLTSLIRWLYTEAQIKYIPNEIIFATSPANAQTIAHSHCSSKRFGTSIATTSLTVRKLSRFEKDYCLERLDHASRLIQKFLFSFRLRNKDFLKMNLLMLGRINDLPTQNVEGILRQVETELQKDYLGSTGEFLGWMEWSGLFDNNNNG